jgi:POT family proton-dependent oligopeptide transporter
MAHAAAGAPEMSHEARRARQPAALYVLFLTEMWERFGFYTMFSLFVLYATQQIGLDDKDAALLYGTFASFAYMTTLPGGFLADRLLGFRRAIILGAVVMCLGYVSLFLATPATLSISLGVLVVGNGLLKPNVGSLLGNFYGEGDPRRESGFTIFYLGINTGAFVATLIAGWIGETFGYDIAFGIAGIGKAISLITFVVGRRWLGDKGLPPDPGALRRTRLGLPPMVYLLAGMVGASLVATFLLRHANMAGELLVTVAAIAFGYFILSLHGESREGRGRAFALLALILVSIVFWTVYNQAGTSFLLFTDRLVDRTVFDIVVPPSDFLSLNPLFILLMGGPFAALWIWLARRGRNPSIPMKFVLGHLLLGAAFLVLFAALRQGGDGAMPWPWLVLFFALYTAAEMVLSPVGLAVTTTLAPERLRGFAMGLWLTATALGYYLAGAAAGIAAVPKGTDDAAMRTIYGSAFLDFGLLAVGGGLVFLARVPWVAGMMRPAAASAARNEVA